MQGVIFIGLQASGKYTFYAARFAKTHLRLNLDMLKTRHREKILFSVCLQAKQVEEWIDCISYVWVMLLDSQGEEMAFENYTNQLKKVRANNE